MYQVRTKKYESRRWIVVSEHDTLKEAARASIKLDYSFRKDIDRQWDAIDVKCPDGTRIKVAGPY